MYHLKVLILFVFWTFINSENCDPAAKINITVYQEIDSVSENETIAGKISYKKDLFHLLVTNETIPILCENFVFIQNELSILQIINSSVRQISAGAFNITPTLALLKIAQNPLNKISKNVFDHIKVKEIDLSQNHISSIDTEAFDNNIHLEVLKLNNNEIKEINPDWFVNTPNIYKLSAVYNEIQLIPAEAFKNMAKHKPLKLRFSSNRIAEFNPNALNPHQNIQLICMNGNKLTVLPDNLFANRTLVNLQVNTNKLRCFPEALFKPALKTLAFIDNISFECECLKKLKKFAEEHDVDVLYPSIICEDKKNEVNIVFNYNKTYEIPLLPPAVDVDVYVKSDSDTNA